MLRPDAHEVGNGPASKTQQQQQQEDAPPGGANTRTTTDWFLNTDNIRKNQGQLSLFLFSFICYLQREIIVSKMDYDHLKSTDTGTSRIQIPVEKIDPPQINTEPQIL